MKRLSYILIAMTLIVASCGGTQYKDPSKAGGSAEWGPKEVRKVVKKMVGSIYTYLKKDWKQPAIIQVKKIRNRTSEHIDTKMISEELVTSLIKKRIQFVDDAFSKDQLAEMEKGMTGLVDPESAVPVGELRSPNFYLYGEISDNVRNVGGKRIQYLVVTLKIKQLSTGMTTWQEQKKFLKSTKTDRISF